MAERNALEKLDFGALSPEQQEKLHQFKIKTREVFLKRPTDIREFAADVKHSPAHDPGEEQDGNNNDNAGLPLWGIALFGIFGAGAFIALFALFAILFRSFRKRKRSVKELLGCIN